MTNKEDKEKEKQKRWALWMILSLCCASFPIGYYFFRENNPEWINFNGNEGSFNGNVRITINKLNRYGLPSEENGVVGGIISPISASGEEPEYIYKENFENETSEWETEQWGQKTTKHYEGDYAYAFRPYFSSEHAKLSLNRTFEIEQNDTFDIVFYSMIYDDFDEGYFIFTFDCFWIDADNFYHEIPITLVIAESESNPYVSTNTSEIVFRQSIQKYIWTGFLIQDIRQSLLDNNQTTVNDQKINIKNCEYIVEESLYFPIFIDYIKIQNTPFEFSNLWFYGHLPITDYQIQIEYNIHANTSAIPDLDKIILRLDIFRLIQTDTEYIDQSIVESISLTNLTFTNDLQSSEYDKMTEGTYFGILHSFPYWNFWGDQLYYSFNTTITAYAPLFNGKTTGDSVEKTLDNQDFSIEWKPVIKVD